LNPMCHVERSETSIWFFVLKLLYGAFFIT
jgi:hypothetical protein